MGVRHGESEEGRGVCSFLQTDRHRGAGDTKDEEEEEGEEETAKFPVLFRVTLSSGAGGSYLSPL